MMERLGDRALRMPRPRVTGNEAAVLSAVRAWPGVVDATMTEQWLAVYFGGDEEPHVDDALVAALESAKPIHAAPREVEMVVRYDGADLDDVARACSVSVERVIALHSGAVYTVLFLGFMPGFAYLGGLPGELEVPRLPSPRTRVPKNAVGVAGRYTGVYPFASAGGWRLIGTAQGASLFDPEDGATLRAGDRVRFRIE